MSKGKSFLDKMTDFIDKKLTPPLIKVGENRYLVAVRDGFTATVPIIIVGSFFLIFANPPPFFGWPEAVAPYVPILNLPNQLTLGLISIFVSFSIAYQLALRYNLDPLMCGLFSTVTFFFLTTAPYETEEGALVVPTTYLDANGLFTAILVSIVTVEVTRYFVSKGLVIKLPPGVPPAVVQSFIALIPGAILLTVAWFIKAVFSLDIPGYIMLAFTPLVQATDTLAAVIIAITLVQLLWFVGIHGANVVGAVITPMMIDNLLRNIDAAMGGVEPLPTVVNAGFSNAWLSPGGTGCTIMLSVLCLRSKSKHLRMIGELSIIPAIFNINEPMTFGLPIILNPLFLPPFLVIPWVIGTVGYLLNYFNIVHRCYLYPPWTTPSPLIAWIATGFDTMAIPWAIFLHYVVPLIGYYPFFKVYEKQMLEKETKEAGEESKE
ncbi:MAG: PTS sugar transporter subunit IIC [Candidatus Asgardarchaeia archaeon]